MKYRVVVYKVYDMPELDTTNEIPFIDREFVFGESSHKVTDVIHMAIDQLEAEGGQPDA